MYTNNLDTFYQLTHLLVKAIFRFLQLNSCHAVAHFGKSVYNCLILLKELSSNIVYFLQLDAR